MSDGRDSFWQNPWVYTIIGGAIAAIIAAGVLGLLHGTSHPSTSSSSTASTSSAPCTFVPGSSETCTSTDAQVVVDSFAHGDTSACTGDFQLNWGDTSEQSVVHSGGSPGPHFLASHKYQTPGTYTINVTATPISGGCAYGSYTYSFIFT
jgi:hypothetical protein